MASDVKLGVPENHEAGNKWRNIVPNEQEEQVDLDVKRSFIYYPNDLSPLELENKKTELNELIVQVLRRHPGLSYFQGFHDIASVFLLTCGYKTSTDIIDHFVLFHIRDCMLPNLSPVLAYLSLLPSLVKAADYRLGHHISQVEPHYALAPFLTLFSHEILDLETATRLFDFFLASNPLMPIYLLAIILIYRRKEILDISQDDHDILHSVLSRIPPNLPFEDLIESASDLFTQNPPNSFGEWRRIGQHSCSRLPIEDNMTLSYGDEMLLLAIKDLRRHGHKQMSNTHVLLSAGAMFVAIAAGWYVQNYVL
ncbi:TBC1 domain family member 20 [Neolecta irregularis DAH-3]|uniref:TBC1 domain family member 20 n=1 Tax=Neolecta irregularis (strain DAH-3) TaxID=1198029 RepID=A0A1U7LV64_NEOID|nr:TBC1 domain family member 20 [Neolecta irregularis DAH-3]|eukprot:OLL26508.1 TBC1 domain family member 20 [Neolecta irregularis DAH-3]